MRVLCLWLPDWSAQRVRVAASADEARPVAVYAPVRNLPRVVACDAASRKRGVAEGLPLAEADALLGGTDPLLAADDGPADLAELKRLAALCGRFGPVAGVEERDRPESILVDVTGCGPFFGGEPSLARQAIDFLADARYASRAGLADTVGVAWAAARSRGGERALLVPAGEGEAWLLKRPIAALRLDAATFSSLDGLGLRVVGDVLRLPRAELPSRFGPGLLRRIDQALGSLPEPIEPVRPAVPLCRSWETEEPLRDRTALAAILSRLVGELVGRLPPWEGIMSLSCRFDDRPPLVAATASPSRSAERLAGLVSLALDREPPPREVVRINVTAVTVRLPPPDRTSLFGDRTAAENDRLFGRLIERLAGRLGEDAVTRPVPTGSHVPERSLRALPVAQAVPAPPRIANVADVSTRPIVLLPEPERVEVLAVYPDGPPHRLRRGGRSVALIVTIGPERIESDWATDPETRRDYWRVETEEAERLWLFLDRRDGGWFLHGLFG